MVSQVLAGPSSQHPALPHERRLTNTGVGRGRWGGEVDKGVIAGKHSIVVEYCIPQAKGG